MNKQQVALVTGSSKGIGQAIALRLAKENFFVYVTYYETETGGQETVDTIKRNGGDALLVRLDVTKESSVVSILKKIEQEQCKLDLLVCNAEKDACKPIEQQTLAEWKLAFDTKVHGAWLCVKYALPLLRESKNPNIVFVSSSADDRPGEDVLTYASATAALNCMIKAWAVHLAKDRIRVNAVCPGPVQTDNWGEARYDSELWKKFAAQNPFSRVATAEEVADAIIPLVNDPHKFLNGNFLFVDGGSNWT